MKRAFDIVVSLIGLTALGWLIVVLAIVIRAKSNGPGIFAQPRVGYQRKIFTCYKLRTMAIGTPVVGTHEIDGSAITGFGARLRRYKLDELPQLWNVLKGDMSLVGPRPCLPVQQDLIRERQSRRVFDVRPGITGSAQVNGIDMSEPARLALVDAQYIEQRSFVGDVALLFKTAVGRGGGDRVR